MNDIIIFIAGMFVGVLLAGIMIFFPVLMYWPDDDTPNKDYWPEDGEVKPTVILCKPGEIETVRRIINEGKL